MDIREMPVDVHVFEAEDVSAFRMNTNGDCPAWCIKAKDPDTGQIVNVYVQTPEAVNALLEGMMFREC